MKNIKKQAGAVLMIGLLMLTVMTLLAVSSMQSSGLQSLMSTNMKDKMTAFEAAELALRSAENFLDNGGAANLGAYDGDMTDGLLANLFDEVWNEVDWQTESISVGTSEIVIHDPDDQTTKGGVKSAPRYVIQHLGPVIPDSGNGLSYGYGTDAISEETLIEMFKITARGTGGSDNTVVVLETIYGVSN